MDDFGIERPELNGTLISMEFGPGGRIQQLWASDPISPEEHEEFQFVAPPVSMAEEVAEDYYPGTILIGMRTAPEDPWILSRNSRAEAIDGEEEGVNVGFEYDLGFVDELQATGRYTEIPGVLPQINWELKLQNRSRRSVEIGELAFPLALNNIYEGFPRNDDGLRELFRDRVYVHKFIGGAASYVYAQRLNAEPPGLLIYPGEDTKWEFFNHVPASLNTPFRWEGIPVVYVCSRAAIEREGWPEWVSGHTSLILEPGESRSFYTRFATVDQLHPALATLERPAIRLFPAAVAPAEVGIALEITGTTPTRFFSDSDAEFETDADENGGFCYVKPSAPGAIRLGFEDTQGRESEAHILLTEPISELIQRRADWIMQHQVVTEDGPFRNAIVPASIEDGNPLLDPETFATPFGVECGLAEALFLAEKNRIFPDAIQIRALDAYLTDFVEDRLLNPGDKSIGSLLPNIHAVAVHSGRASIYPLVACLYDAMAKVASGYGETLREPEAYMDGTKKALEGMMRHGNLEEGQGLPLMSYVYDLMKDLGMYAERSRRLTQMRDRRYPFSAESIWNTTGFEESFAAAAITLDDRKKDRTLRYQFAARCASPSWWWYGADKRWLEDTETGSNLAMPDKGEMCLGPTTVSGSISFLSTLERDSDSVDEYRMRLAFGGLLGVWALVRSDGAAGMGFCPDAASKQFGVSWTTGDVGISLFHYLRGVASYVLPSRYSGVQTFGCFFETENLTERESFLIRPWDGVGRRIVVRHLGLDVSVRNGRILELRFDARKRHASITVENPSDKKLAAHLSIKGLWGIRFKVDNEEMSVQDGILEVMSLIPALETARIEVKVIE